MRDDRTFGFYNSYAPRHTYELQRMYVLQHATNCEYEDCENQTTYRAAYGKIGEYWSLSKILCEFHIGELEPFDVISDSKIERDTP